MSMVILLEKNVKSKNNISKVSEYQVECHILYLINRL